MPHYPQALARLSLAVALLTTPAAAVNRIVIFPSGNTNQLPVLRAEDLTLAGTVAAPSSSFRAVPSLDGSKFYILTRRASPSIVVVEAATLRVLRTVELSGSVTAGELSPDGKYLFAATGTIHAIDTSTDLPVGAPIPVGGSPTQIAFDDGSTKAYILAAAGQSLAVIDLATLAVERTVNLPNATRIAVSGNGSRLLAVFRDGIRQFRTRDLTEISTIPGKVQLINARLHPLPNGVEVLVENSGVGADKTAQLIHLDNGEVYDVGTVGSTQIRNAQVVSNSKAFAIDPGTNQVLELDLSARPNVTATPKPYGDRVRTLSLSPNRRTLFVSSLNDATVLRVDTATGNVERSASLSFAPDSHEAVFGPSTLSPASIVMNGGDGQYFPPNSVVPIPFSVRVTDIEGTPLPNVPVLFQDALGAGLTLSPSQPSFTNSRGVATVVVSIPEDPTPTVGVDGANGAPPVEPADGVLQLTVSATTAGLDPALFSLNVIRRTGLIKISGDNQGVDENRPFDLPFVLLATDETGRPLPAGTELTFGFSSASCPTEAKTDENGFILINNCSAFPMSTNPNNTQLFQPGTITASYFDSTNRQVRAAFNFIVIRSGNRFGLSKLAGDNQTAASGSTLPIPLTFRIGLINGFGGTNDPFNVEMRQISGPPVFIEERRVPTRMNFNREVRVVLGENAGVSVIEARASVPGLPTVRYTVTATGGKPTALRKTGDNQSGKIATTLPTRLRVEVVNETGTLVPFPEITWRVIQGNADLATGSDQNGGFATVTFKTTPGTVRVVAAAGILQETFTLNALAPEPASISTAGGQNQVLTTGTLSEPLLVRVNELDNRPAIGAPVTFSGPPNVRLHPLDGSPPGNPVMQLANAEGVAGVRAELLSVAALGIEGAPPAQLAQTVTIVASAGGQLSTSFLLNVSGRTPSFSSQGVVNAASFQPGIVPGSIVTIFGSGMMEGVVGDEFPNGATAYKGTVVRVGGIPTPLLGFSTRNGEQISFQAPFELAPNQTTTVEIENNGSRSTIGGVPVFAAQPGIFEYDSVAGGRFAAALHGNFRVVGPDDPARHGETIAVFATGVGRITPPVGTGVLAPATPLSNAALPIVVGVDNKGADVPFAGYAPGFLGLYQINVTIPPDARCGQRALNLKVGDSFSLNSTIPILCPQ